MTDDVFRQRRPISQTEIGQEPVPSPADVKAAFDRPEPQMAPNMTGNMPNPVSIKNMQNAPAHFLQQIAANQAQPNGPENVETPRPNPYATTANYGNLSAEHLAAQNTTLKNVLDAISDSTTVYEKITLPSLGRFYTDEGPRDGILHIRPMTGQEENILASQRLVKKGMAINMIFDQCIREKYHSENFLAIDRTFLLIYLRGISYGTNYDVDVTCPFTDKKFQHSIQLNLEVEECPADFSPSSLKGVLPRTNLSFSYRLATGLDEQKMQDHRDMKAKFDTTNQADDSLNYRTALLIEEIGGVSDKNGIQAILNKLPAMDTNYLRNVTGNPPLGVNTTIPIISPFTGEEFEIELPIETSFFFPKQRKVPTQA